MGLEVASKMFGSDRLTLSRFDPSKREIADFQRGDIVLASLQTNGEFGYVPRGSHHPYRGYDELESLAIVTDIDLEHGKVSIDPFDKYEGRFRPINFYDLTWRMAPIELDPKSDVIRGKIVSPRISGTFEDKDKDKNNSIELHQDDYAVPRPDPETITIDGFGELCLMDQDKRTIDDFKPGTFWISGLATYGNAIPQLYGKSGTKYQEFVDLIKIIGPDPDSLEGVVYTWSQELKENIGYKHVLNPSNKYVMGELRSPQFDLNMRDRSEFITRTLQALK